MFLHSPDSITKGAAALPNRTILLSAKLAASTITTVAFAIVTIGCLREIYLVSFVAPRPLGGLNYLALFDERRSVVNWFQPIILFFNATLFALTAAFARQDADKDWKRWAALSGVFAFMSLDESVNAHQAVFESRLAGHGSLAQWAPILIVTAGIAVYLAPMLRRITRRYALQFLGCGFIFVGGAVGMDIISNAIRDQYGSGALSYGVTASLEEGLETLGAAFLIRTLFDYLSHRWLRWAISIE